MPVPDRRPFLQLSLSGLLTWAAPSLSMAGPRVAPRAESPLVGVDPVFVSTGLTARWQNAMRRDLGWAARWQPMDTGAVLTQLDQGQLDAGLFLYHPQADHLDKQGLIYNRQTVARTAVLLLGPSDDLAGIRSERDPARALSQVLAAANAGAANWAMPPAGSALAALADQLTQGQASKPSAARATGKVPPPSAAYRLVTRAQYLKAPPAGERLKIWLAGGPGMALDAQVACSFRARHAGAKLLVSWLQWPLAQGAVKASGPGWQSIKG
jgi:hypothetical protein